MFFLGLLTSVLSSEYLVRLIIRSQVLLFLGPEDRDPVVKTTNELKFESSEHDLFSGTFYLESSDNFAEYLTELGLGYFLRQLALLAFPILTITRSCSGESPCEWSLKTDAAVRTHLVTFQLGEEVEDLTMDGRTIRTVFTRPAWNRIVEEQVGETVNTTIIRDFFKDRMEVSMAVNNVNATSVFIRN